MTVLIGEEGGWECKSEVHKNKRKIVNGQNE